MKRKKRREKIVGSRILYEICDWSKAILTGLAVGFFVSSTLIANAQVPSGSMEETIMTGSRIIINRLAYMSQEPSRGLSPCRAKPLKELTEKYILMERCTGKIT